MSVAHQPHPNTNRVISPERNSAESESTPPENGFTKKQKQIIAGIALLAVITGGGVSKLFGKSEATPSPAHPNVAVSDIVNPGETQKAPAIPNEAKKFVSEVGNRYADPVSTYYATEAYKKEHAGKSPVLSDEFINSYDNSGPQDGDLSILGFTAYRLPLDAEVSKKTLIDIFNSYLKPNLDLYMNLLSKNPSGKAVTIIDNEFKTYCSDNILKHDDTGFEMLVATAKNEVAEHGSAANFSVAGATDKSKTKDVTLFPLADGIMTGGIPWGTQGDVLKNYAEGGINLVLDADEYNGKTFSHISKVKHGFTFVVWRQPVTGDADYSNISIGQNN